MFTRYLPKNQYFQALTKKFSNLKSFANKKIHNGISKSIYLPGAMISTMLYYTVTRKYNTFSAGESTKYILEGFISLQDGEMREYKYGTKPGESILIVRRNGKFHALSNSCPHFGAPMHTGNYYLIFRCVN